MDNQPNQRDSKIYAYLRVSTTMQGDQSIESQRSAVVAFAFEKGFIGQIQYFEDIVSGYKVHWQKRKIAKLVDSLQPGDVVIFPELSRVSRKISEIFQLLDILRDKKVTVHVIKPKFDVDDSIQSKVLTFAFTLSAEIEREMISQRTKEGQAAARARGKFAGRPKGTSETRMLDAWGEQIFEWLDIGLSLVDILKLVNNGREKPLSYQTLLDWMDFRSVPKKRDKLELDIYKQELKQARNDFRQKMKEIKAIEKEKAKSLESKQSHSPA